MQQLYHSHKTHIETKIFYAYITLIFCFTAIFSINFLISNLIEKEQLIWSLVPQ